MNRTSTWSRRAASRLGVTDECPAGQIGERVTGEVPRHLVGDRNPHFLQDAVTLAVVVLVGQRGEGAVDRRQDLGETDLLRRPGQDVPAADPALRADEPARL